MDEVEELLRRAYAYHSEAMRMLERGDYADACEKIWASVKSATAALTLRYMGRTEPPRGTSWRTFVAQAFVKAGLSEREAGERADYFISVRDRLHGACFYGLIYDESEHRPLIERAGEYIEDVRRALGLPSPQLVSDIP